VSALCLRYLMKPAADGGRLEGAAARLVLSLS
jgi:hypothetical protein